MAKSRKGARPDALVPNLALRKVREATGLTIGAFAKLVGVSAAYIQAVEIGQRPVSNELAEKIRDRTGAWPRSISENWVEPVDVNGSVYTAATYQHLTRSQPEPSNFEGLERELTDGLTILLKGAAGAGKSALAMSVIRDKLHEAATRILLLDGVSEMVSHEWAAAGNLTVGQLRNNPHLAKAVGFRDDPSRRDDAVIVLQHQSPRCQRFEDLLEKFLPVVDSRVTRNRTSCLYQEPTKKKVQKRMR